MLNERKTAAAFGFAVTEGKYETASVASQRIRKRYWMFIVIINAEISGSEIYF